LESLQKILERAVVPPTGKIFVSRLMSSSKKRTILKLSFIIHISVIPELGGKAEAEVYELSQACAT
jgi:hypothetical protein